MFSKRGIMTAMLSLILTAMGCAENGPSSSSRPDPAGEHSSSPAPPAETSNPEKVTENKTAAEPLPELPVITFGNETAQQGVMSGTSAGNGDAAAAEKQSAETVIAKLKELQILLGSWRGITQKEYGGFKAVDATEWVWDFRTDRKQPALKMESSESPFYRVARMTYLPASEQYQLTVTDPENKTAVYQGQFLQPIENEQGDDGKPQRTYKLEFTEQDAADGEALRFAFNQQNNNRYLLEIYRQRKGSDRFFRIDTVSTQREGTSLALIDEGYGEKTCIISGGLGTISVSYQGQTYYVCCTGCKAAFEEDPARWIARASEQKK